MIPTGSVTDTATTLTHTPTVRPERQSSTVANAPPATSKCNTNHLPSLIICRVTCVTTVCSFTHSTLTTHCSLVDVAMSNPFHFPPLFSTSALPSYLRDDKRSGGYPTELFDETELDCNLDLVCCICDCVCRQVVACPDAGCAALFCSGCLDEWVEKGHPRCPKCQGEHNRPAFQSNGYAQKKIRGLKVNCPNQCGTPLLIGVGERSIKEHLTQHCANRSVLCSLICGAVLRNSEMAAHIEICPRNIVPCPNGCYQVQRTGQLMCSFKPSFTFGSFLTTRQKLLLPSHIRDECPNTKRECERCHVLVRRCDWDEHQRSNETHQLREARERIQILSQVVFDFVKEMRGACQANEMMRKLELQAPAFSDSPQPTEAEIQASEKPAGIKCSCDIVGT